jgi:hypothetical protein
MTVTCRSNDAIWGAHGANAVHFSVLQEYVAAAVGVLVGPMVQLSNNYHIYADREDVRRLLDTSEFSIQHSTAPIHYHTRNLYAEGARAVPLLQYKEEAKDLLADCECYFAFPEVFTPRTYYFQQVFLPMMTLHALYKDGAIDTDDKLHDYSRDRLMEACDWHIAGVEWVARRLKAKQGK